MISLAYARISKEIVMRRRLWYQLWILAVVLGVGPFLLPRVAVNADCCTGGISSQVDSSLYQCNISASVCTSDNCPQSWGTSCGFPPLYASCVEACSQGRCQVGYECTSGSGQGYVEASVWSGSGPPLCRTRTYC